MIWLILGVALWSVVHFIPSLGLALKKKIISRFGDKVYKIAFALSIVASVLLIVLGWRSTTPEMLYHLPDWSRPLTIFLMLVAFLLMGASGRKTVIGRVIRHPQLSGMVVWAIAHLISNGDTRSLVLFGGLGLWALIEIPLINAREGEWVKPEKPPIGAEIKGIVISFVVFVVVMFLHPYFTGAPVIPH